MSMITSELRPRFRPSVASAKGRIRPLVENDFDQVRRLGEKIGGNGSIAGLKQGFFDSPWRESELDSLAFEDRGGRITGCLAMTSRPMMFRDRPIRAAIGHHLIVESSRAGARAAIELARRFLRGPQDLSIAVWNDLGRRVWTSLGGSVASLHSLTWTRPLRPARYFLSMLTSRVLPLSVFGNASAPQRPPAALSDDLDAVTMLSYLSAFASDRVLKPSYDVASLAWLLDALDNAAHRRLHKVAVRTAGGRPLGWYVYHLAASGAADVLQVGGRSDALREVLNHLFDHARQRGAVEISGPMDARLVGPLSEQHCAFHRPRNTWALIHSRDARIGEAIHSGEAFLSRLEGAPWLEIEG